MVKKKCKEKRSGESQEKTYKSSYEFCQCVRSVQLTNSATEGDVTSRSDKMRVT